MSVVAAGVVAAAAIAVPAQAATTPADSASPGTTSSATTPFGAAAAQPLSAIEDQAQEALVAARAALASAASLTSDVSASGLQLEGDASIDTAGLQDAVDALDPGEFALSPVLFLPELTADVATATERVETKTADVSVRLDDAKAKAEAERLAAEAAAAAQAAAEAAAAQAAAEAAAAADAAQSSSSSSPSSSAPSASVPGAASSGDNSPAGAQASAYAMLSSYGWGDDQWGCLVSLWNRESGWNYQAYNSGSGATGIPQALPGSKMASAGSDWATNAATQIRWGLGYIADRYGNPCGAWNHSESVGWY